MTDDILQQENQNLRARLQRCLSRTRLALAALDAHAAATDEAYAADLEAIAADETKDVETFQTLMNQRYGSTC